MQSRTAIRFDAGKSASTRRAQNPPAPPPKLFRLANNHAVAMRERFVGQAGGMHATDDHLDAAAAEVIGNFVSTLRRDCHYRDADEIGALRKIELLDFSSMMVTSQPAGSARRLVKVPDTAGETSCHD